MDIKEFRSIAESLGSAMRRLEVLRAAEASISADGTQAKNTRIWIGDIEIHVTEKHPDNSHHTIRGREMMALGLKKLLQGQIKAKEAEIATLRQRMNEVTA